MELFVSDLDGTLLNKDQVISDYSKRELNRLINTGINFAIATARSPATVSDILDGRYKNTCGSNEWSYYF